MSVVEAGPAEAGPHDSPAEAGPYEESPAKGGSYKAVQLRAITSPTPPRPSSLVGIAYALADYLLLALASAIVIAAPWWLVKLLAVGLAGTAVAMLFALAHDAAHGSLAASRWMNRLLATVCFLPSWYPFTPWIRGHNHLHHGWTNIAECDYSWRPVSPAQYQAMPLWRRGLEQIYRSWWGLWLHSILEIWWKHMANPRAEDRRHLRSGPLHADRALVLLFVTAHVLFCLLVAPAFTRVAGGPSIAGPLLVGLLVVGPWWVFHVMFSVVTFLHHTHPRVPWVRTRQESSFFTGQVQATVHVTLPVWIELLLHNITVHGAHHVDARIPFRHLPDAQRRLAGAFPGNVIIERWSLARFIATARTCQLYDYDRREWCTFRSIRPDAVEQGVENVV